MDKKRNDADDSQQLSLKKTDADWTNGIPKAYVVPVVVCFITVI